MREERESLQRQIELFTSGVRFRSNNRDITDEVVARCVVGAAAASAWTGAFVKAAAPCRCWSGCLS